ncbi:uncharacterized protein MYCFIDRAFT_209204 [Pseudocercospora fijiensis CIRAD86]|uniref:Metallo-beta-lactamase domain-containing protein n=1 Tax=Pseudocercospora fijiensis (strain CIRAD86) TaxID=383855 RepID=M2YJF3_PSEFD|nr:uncharacterized protein MYCFIDRAFT_209204 [Pseudocercospora fijiensis CIRAD86]EME77865.1 hypothetical protein MYCFIDRAFT_209204 [Pseudocercospora fijiensis CIRAD86]
MTLLARPFLRLPFSTSSATQSIIKYLIAAVAASGIRHVMDPDTWIYTLSHPLSTGAHNHLILRHQALKSHSLTTTKIMEQLPHLPAIERLSPRVIRILGGNPSKFTLQGTNTYLLGTGPKRLLLDTAEGKNIWKTSLQKVLKEENASIEKVILTHWHPDHVGGVEDVKEICSGGGGGSGNGNVKIYKNQRKPGRKDEVDFQNGEVFEVEGARIHALHSPGHTVDHMAFFLEEEDAMFTGDNVLGHGTAVFEDLGMYVESLRVMERAFKGRAYPAHGDVVEDGPGKVREYLEHRRMREEEVLETLKGEKPGETEGWTSMELVKVIYRKYPENLWGPAEGGVKQVLAKLEGEGKVVKFRDGSWGLVAGKAAL